MPRTVCPRCNQPMIEGQLRSKPTFFSAPRSTLGHRDRWQFDAFDGRKIKLGRRPDRFHAYYCEACEISITSWT